MSYCRPPSPRRGTDHGKRNMADQATGMGAGITSAAGAGAGNTRAAGPTPASAIPATVQFPDRFLAVPANPLLERMRCTYCAGGA